MPSIKGVWMRDRKSSFFHQKNVYFLMATAMFFSLFSNGYSIGNDPKLDLNHFHPRPGSSSGKILGVDLGEIGPHSAEEDEARKNDPNVQFYPDKWKWEFVPQLFLHYGYRPLQYIIGPDTANPNYLGYIVKHRLTGDVSLSFSLKNRIQFALALPVTFYQSGDFIDPASAVPGLTRDWPYPIATAGQEDLRFSVKSVFYNTKLTGRKHTVDFGIGGVGEIAFPTGDANNFLGSSGVNGDLKLIGHLQWKRLTVGLNFGGHFAATERLVNVQTGHGLVYGVGAQVELFRHKHGPFYILSEVNGETHYPFNSKEISPAELSLAVKTDIKDWSLYVGGGPGLNKGYGVPDGRVYLGASYAFHAQPKKIPPDLCKNIEGLQSVLPPNKIQDPQNPGMCICKEGMVPDKDGNCVCPEGTFPDGFGQCIVDICRNIDGLQTKVPDDKIQDPQNPKMCICKEGMVLDKDGNCVCPEGTFPGDSGQCIVDICRNIDGLQTSLPPNKIEDPQNPKMCICKEGMVLDKDGNCVKARVQVKEDRIELSERIFFDLDKDTIKPISFPILDEAVSVLKARPKILKVQIEGHTDTVGKKLYNIDLSKRRARSVVQYLIDHGIDSSRLVAVGFGMLCPSEKATGPKVNPRKGNVEKYNNTPAKRAANRRVDFIILEQEGVKHKPPRCGEPPALGKFSNSGK